VAHYDAPDPWGNAQPRVLPKVPGINAQPMTRNQGIGHTPWRVAASTTPRVRGVGTAVPTGGTGTRSQQPRKPTTAKKKRRKPRSTAPSGATLHALWAQGKL
jgi:hypothetical protein